MDFPQLSAARARFIHCVWCRREKDFFCVFWRNFWGFLSSTKWKKDGVRNM